MKRQLDDSQITQARALRAEGKSYPEIKAAIGADVAHDTIRAHCADVTVAGVTPRKGFRGTATGKDGRTIRGFTAEEDAAITAWWNDPSADEIGQTLADLARRLDRKRHSVAARIQTLKKRGLLPD